jgi:hypothetical protein
MDQAERKLFVQAERERTRRAAEEQRQRLRAYYLETPYEGEDPVEEWRRENREQEQRFAAERQRERDEERRAREHSAVAEMQGELAEVLEGIASALGALDDRLRALEERRTRKSTRASRPIALPIGPTHAANDREVRYSQPKIQ